MTAELDDPIGAGAGVPTERAAARSGCAEIEGHPIYLDYWAYMAPPLNVSRVLLYAEHQSHFTAYLGQQGHAERGRGNYSVVHVS